MKNKKQTFGALVAASLVSLIVLGLLAVGSFAWYSRNKRVTTDTVSSVRSGSQELILGISPTENGSYGPLANVTKLSIGDVLDPVSTADLTTFYRNVAMSGDQATQFAETTEGYFYGQVFLSVQATGQSENARVRLYLDTDGIVLNESGDTPGLMKNAARVGLVFHDAYSGGSYIFNLSPDHNGSNDTYHNTTLNGVAQSGDMVLANQNGVPAYAPDPSIDPAIYTVTPNGDGLTLPDKPLAVLNLNQIVTVDIYFYLEGCDSDCTNIIRTTEMSVQLPFYGILAEDDQ